MSGKVKIGVLVSGRGSNLGAIIDACKTGKIPGEVVVVISNRQQAYALERAKIAGIEAMFIDPKEFKNLELYSDRLCAEMQKRNVEIICLAGFLLKLTGKILQVYKNRILNIHPALLPEFGGKGMYGLNVHKAVIASGKKVSGCTVHIVDEEYDHGEIILQRKVAVLPEDTPQTLAERVLKEEHIAYPEAINIIISRLNSEKNL